MSPAGRGLLRVLLKMKLVCPRCSDVLEVPDKAVLYWRQDCPNCKTKLVVATVEVEDDSSESVIDFVLCEAEAPMNTEGTDSLRTATTCLPADYSMEK